MLTLLIICLIRALRFKPIKEIEEKDEPAIIDKDAAVKCLQELIKCRTVSNTDKTKEDESEFAKLKAKLQELYPEVYKASEFQELGPRELLFHIKGMSGDHRHASILLAHFDVVDVERENWSEDPFSGVIKDGVLYGRGTIDTKGTLNGALFGLNSLLKESFVPQNDLYLAFAGDEEIQGGSAKLAVRYFQDHQIEPLFVLDEGGAVVDGIFPGVSKPVACVGTAEKGALSLKFTLDGEGGHASAPLPHTPVGKLAKLAVAIEDNPYKMRLTKPVKEMFDILGRESTFAYRFVFANLFVFKPILNKLTLKSGGQLNAIVRTTVALTMMKGAPVTNVVPSDAMIGFNMRLLPGDDVEEAKKRYADLAKKEGVGEAKIEADYAWNASKISTTDSDGYRKLSKAIKGAWGKDLAVSPYIMTACSDSRYYSPISDKVYRFSAAHLSSKDLEGIHGDNESVTTKQIAETCEFYYRLIRSL